jgi:hypothetical protein
MKHMDAQVDALLHGGTVDHNPIFGLEPHYYRFLNIERKMFANACRALKVSIVK